MQPLLQWIQFDVPQIDLRAFRLKENPSARRKCACSFVGQFAVYVLPHMPVAVHKFHNVPLAVRLFQFVGGIAKASDVFEFTVVEAVDARPFPRRTNYARSVRTCKLRTIGHPEIARAALVDLELDRPRPHLVFALNVVENAAVARLSLARRKCTLAPLELGAKIIVLVLLFCDEVPEFRT